MEPNAEKHVISHSNQRFHWINDEGDALAAKPTAHDETPTIEPLQALRGRLDR